MSKTVLITGAAGFAGHHMVEHFLKNTDWKVIGVDCLNYSGTWERLRDVIIMEPGKIPVTGYAHPNFTPLTYDFRRPAEPNLLRELRDVTHILHLGAESHVDASIADPLKFVRSNVEGTVNMLNVARELPNLELFVYFSTDEVFGPAPMLDPKNPPHPYDEIAKKGFPEDYKHDPKNPYAASKSAAEQFVTSFANTYGLPCIITRQMNIFGERQHHEKFIPLCIRAARDGEKVFIHGTPDKKRAGVRSYIHARNVADAHLWLLKEKPWLSKKSWEKTPEAYHIVGEIEIDNLKLAQTINDYVKAVNKCAKGLDTEIVDFHSSRAGHDLRYALDGRKIEGLGWKPPKTFHTGLKKVVEWTLENYKWIDEIWLKEQSKK